MKKMLMAIVCFAYVSPMAFAQENEVSMPKEKKFDHYAGVQVNGLIRQVFNFSNANNVNDNPYLLMYSIKKRKNGWGLRAGGGYSSRSFATNDGITESESDINNLQARLGIEKNFKLSDKWTAGAGLDGVYSVEKNRTNTITRAFDTSTVKTNTSVTSYGGGVMAWLRYNITEKILIGTEASFYQRYGKQQLNITITERTNTFPGNTMVTTITKKDHNLTEGVISLPVAIYLIVKF